MGGWVGFTPFTLAYQPKCEDQKGTFQTFIFVSVQSSSALEMIQSQHRNESVINIHQFSTWKINTHSGNTSGVGNQLEIVRLHSHQRVNQTWLRSLITSGVACLVDDRKSRPPGPRQVGVFPQAILNKIIINTKNRLYSFF